jgi:release factor glutamine methyltransferase
MRRFFKRILSFFLVPAVRWYLRKERKHRYRGVTVKVFPGVFHPGLFSSTHFLIDFLSREDLRTKTLLELGCGSGLISVWAARQGAQVTASDLSTKAISNTVLNAKFNSASIRIVRSDLFDNLGKERFDWIVINPPYYARAVRDERDLAWHCGENMEYFQKLFTSMADHIHEDSQVIMILTKEGCDVSGIIRIAEKHSFYLHLLKERNALLDERDYLFGVRLSLSARVANSA